MFKVAAAASDKAERAEIVTWASAQSRCALRYPATRGRGRWLHDLVESLQKKDPRAIFVRIPQDPDRIERVILEIAKAVDAGAVEAVAVKLRAEPEVPDQTLALLSTASEGRRFIVDGWSALESTEEVYTAGHALDARVEATRNWISARAWVIADCAMTPPQGFATRSLALVPETPPSVLLNGTAEARLDLWERFAPNVGDYETALALIALDELSHQRAIPPAWKLREHVSRSLPPAARELLYLASVHARPLAPEVIAQLEASLSAQDLLVRLGICRSGSGGLLADPAWTSWCLEGADVRCNEYHVKLAKAFAALASPTDAFADRAALPILEAHRHYLAAGEYETAAPFARYGAAMLVEEGRRRSLALDYGNAARVYQGILDLADAGQLPTGQRLRGYVKHYIHFNRARAEVENIRDTERGYHESVMLWPENALFWSRLIRTQFYRGAKGEALQTLTTAQQKVPDHREKQTALIARTVRGLLEPRRQGAFLLEAVLVWDDFQPTTEFSKEVEEILERAVSNGWAVRSLDLPDVPPIWFIDPQRVRILRSEGFWFAELQDLNFGERGVTPKDALTNLARGLRKQVAYLLCTLAHQLEPQVRLQKQVLLGVVDVIASRLDASALEYVWLVGDVYRSPGDNKSYFVTNGSQLLEFEIPPALEAKIVINDIPYLAQVVTGLSGIPVGPIRSLEPAYGSSDSVLQAWFQKVRDVG